MSNTAHEIDLVTDADPLRYVLCCEEAHIRDIYKVEVEKMMERGVAVPVLQTAVRNRWCLRQRRTTRFSSASTEDT